MEIRFEKNKFSTKLKSMLKVDFRRMFTMPLVYIMVGVSFIIPILILVMTTMMPETTIDPVTGAETTIETFTNVWQSIGSASGTAMSMDLTSVCNINMIYFLIVIFVCLFVGDDFRSGYAKNIFTIRSKKVDYCLSKTAVGFVGGAMMIIAYFIGAMLGGTIANLPFDTGVAGISGIVYCMLSKVFLVTLFVAISLLLSVVGKQKLWLSILGSLAVSMLLFTMIPMMTPLDSSLMNVIICLGGGVLFAIGLGALSSIVLNKTSLV